MEVVAYHVIEPGEEIVMSCEFCISFLDARILTSISRRPSRDPN